MLPAIAQDWAETTGALWSSRTMMVRPLSSVVVVTPAGTEEKSPLEIGLLITLNTSGQGIRNWDEGKSNSGACIPPRTGWHLEIKQGNIEHRTLNAER